MFMVAGSAFITCLSLKVTSIRGTSVALLVNTLQLILDVDGTLERNNLADLPLATKGSNLTVTLAKYLVIILFVG